MGLILGASWFATTHNEVEILATRSRGRNLVLGLIRATELEGAVYLGFQRWVKRSEP